MLKVLNTTYNNTYLCDPVLYIVWQGTAHFFIYNYIFYFELWRVYATL